MHDHTNAMDEPVSEVSEASDEPDEFLDIIDAADEPASDDPAAMLRVARNALFIASGILVVFVAIWGVCTIRAQVRTSIDDQWSVNVSDAQRMVDGMQGKEVVSAKDAKLIDDRFGKTDAKLHKQYGTIDRYWTKYDLMRQLLAVHPADDDYRTKRDLNDEVKRAGGFASMNKDSNLMLAYGDDWGAANARTMWASTVVALRNDRDDMLKERDGYKAALDAWHPAVQARCADMGRIPVGHRTLCDAPKERRSQTDTAALERQADDLLKARTDSHHAAWIIRTDDKAKALSKRLQARTGLLRQSSSAAHAAMTQAVAILGEDVPDGGRDAGNSGDHDGRSGRTLPAGTNGGQDSDAPDTASGGVAGASGGSPGTPARPGDINAPRPAPAPDMSLFEVHSGRVPVYYRGDWISAAGSSQVGARLSFGIMSFQSISYTANPMSPASAPAPFGGTPIAAMRLASDRASDVTVATYRMDDGSYATGVFFAGQSYRVVR